MKFPFTPISPWLRVLMAFLLVGLVYSSGCATMQRAAIGNVADILAGDGAGGAFASDPDPELIREALPFGLKLQESLILASPEHRGLHLATASGFIQYASAFVEVDADEVEEDDYKEAQQIRKRASSLYLRGRNYAFKGLDLAYAGFEDRFKSDPDAALIKVKKRDTAYLFWLGAGWAGAISADSGNMSLVAELPMVEKIMGRALDLDPDFERGALHEFFIMFEGARSEAMGGSPKRAREHFEKALDLQKGKKASPYVALASTVAVQEQDVALFKDLLDKALAVDENGVEEWRLANILAKRMAERLLSRISDLFVVVEVEEE